MPSNTIQLIAIDLDGTLLDSNGRLSSENQQAIQQAVKQGVRVILATGKTRWSAEAVIAQLQLQSQGVFTQGLQIFDADGTVLHETRLPRETAVSILHHLHQKELPYVAYCSDALRVASDHPYRHLLHEKYHEPLPRVVSNGQDGWPINKLLISDEQNNDQTRAELQALFGEQVMVTQAVSEFIEVLPKNTSKGAGLQWLLARLGIPETAVMAIGDGENDLEMLALAGLGVSMGNAHPRVKAIANAQVGSNDQSGVAQAIHQFVFAQKPLA